MGMIRRNQQWNRLTRQVPQEALLWDVAPGRVESSASWRSLVRRAMDCPCGSAAVRRRVDDADRVTILVDDRTRPTPQDRILPPLLDYLCESGVSEEDITVVIALGTHRYMSRAEMWERFGPVCSRVDVFNHAWRDHTEFAAVGGMPGENTLRINRHAVAAEVVIGVGSIVPHIWAGWGGGAKIMMPGIASATDIAPTHSLAERSEDITLISGQAQNACRKGIEEAALAGGLDLILNCVVDVHGTPEWVGAGDPVTAHREGVEAAQELFLPRVHRRADIVLADARPADADYWQGIKALVHAARGTQPGGCIILTGRFEGGVSSTHPEFVEHSRCSPEEIGQLAEEDKIKDPVIVTTLKLHATVLQRYTIICLSPGLSSPEKRKLGFVPADSVDEALCIADKESGHDPSFGIVRYAGDTVPSPEGTGSG